MDASGRDAGPSSRCSESSQSRCSIRNLARIMVCCYSYAYVVAWLVFCYVTMSFCLHRYICSEVYVKDFPIWLPGTILKVQGPLSYHVTLQDGHVLCRHVNHIYRLNLSPLHWMTLTCSQMMKLPNQLRLMSVESYSSPLHTSEPSYRSIRFLPLNCVDT